MRSDDLTAEEVQRYADGELAEQAAAEAADHLRTCPRCAAAVLELLQMKRAVRETTPRLQPSSALRARVAAGVRGTPMAVPVTKTSAAWWIGIAAAVIVAVVLLGALRARGVSAAHELADMHATVLASATPVDVLSTDRHTVRPWFEGRVPFAVRVPELEGSPFHLIGGRVVFWRNSAGAYLLVGKGAHRISVFVFPAAAVPVPGRIPSVSTLSWSADGLRYIAVADLPQEDLVALERAFAR